jgi:hypothetical protein
MATALPAKKRRRKTSPEDVPCRSIAGKSDQPRGDCGKALRVFKGEISAKREPVLRVAECCRIAMYQPSRPFYSSVSVFPIGSVRTSRLLRPLTPNPFLRRPEGSSDKEDPFDVSTSRESSSKNPQRPKTARTIHRSSRKYSAKHSSFRTPRDTPGPSCRRGVRRTSVPRSSISRAAQANL